MIRGAGLKGLEKSVFRSRTDCALQPTDLEDLARAKERLKTLDGNMP
jgi:hypothetical protein